MPYILGFIGVVVAVAAIWVLSRPWNPFLLPMATSDRRLGTFRFSNPMSFDAASLGAPAKEVIRELRDYDRARSTSGMSNRGLRWLQTGGAETHWKGFRRFYVDLAAFLGTTPDLISLHENTTAAVRAACESILMTDRPDLVITTDMEYASVGSAVRDVFPEVAELALRHWTLQNGPVSTQLATRLAAMAVEAIRSRSGIRRIVLVTSHVYYESGCVLDVRALGDAMKAWDCRLIIDGAQAVGNIAVDVNACGDIDYYATCGHKWLMGRPSLGVLVSGRSRQNHRHEGATLRVTRPFSTLASLMSNDYKSETIAIEPLISVNAVVAEFHGMDDWAGHNRALARFFAREVVRLKGLRPITLTPESGIVSLQVSNAVLLRERLEMEYGIACQALGADLLRFGFHYFHRERDVLTLLRRIEAVLGFQSRYDVGVSRPRGRSDAPDRESARSLYGPSRQAARAAITRVLSLQSRERGCKGTSARQEVVERDRRMTHRRDDPFREVGISG